MTRSTKKIVGRHRIEDPLVKLARINRGLKELGCKPLKQTSTTVYKKVVGRQSS